MNQVKTNYRNNKDDINIKTNYGNNKNNVGVKTNYGNDKGNIFLTAATCHILLLPPFCLANVLHLGNDTISMAKFDMMRSSQPASSMAVSLGLLTSAANWEYGNIQDICARMLEVSRIGQEIYVQFRHKTRLWQVSVLTDICLKKTQCLHYC